MQGLPGAVTIATNMAGRGTDIKLGPGVKACRGLHIIGTERHEARRIDRQLRGRSGRQGDPGSSRFYLSLEDDLMRLFGSERIARIMERMGLKEGEVIQHSMITKSVERAQKKVEENNYGIRKRLLEYGQRHESAARGDLLAAAPCVAGRGICATIFSTWCARWPRKSLRCTTRRRPRRIEE